MKVLILRFSSIGDIVLTTPVVRGLKQQIPGAEIHFCTKRAYASLIEHNPFIDRCHYLDSSLWVLVRRLQAERFDLIIDLHNNVRTSLIKAALLTKAHTVNKLNIRKWVYVRWKWNVMPEEHIVDRYMATVQPLGVAEDGFGLDYFIPDRDQISKTELPLTHQLAYVAYAIGGQHATKRLPVGPMIELCKKIDAPIVLLGDAEDRETGDAVVQALGSQLIYNACGQYSLNQSASLLQQAQVVFSHDTGLMHMAAALKKTVYSIWGSTTFQLGMYPYKTRYVLIENKGLSCRPCSKIGHNQCPKQHFRCMNDLSFESVESVQSSVWSETDKLVQTS
ncbi:MULTISPECIES: glycosyltransferase family 9 protein [unclassified Spirosoma]|uniref:glycosyltransferase family 9 protein n=1 Tax=unclassified Spirosoma TaxID=2621999 RepID=UPI00096921C5|nr:MULTISPECIES: glycosyltransferase family 9 protein [unclassified Spirosoma]MBN8820656.1 glycosyltransferase family 9 protein [Spirosoma sp.]OJW78031.1 MAG: glycosyl transferase [Spirosoma sp. 48-14]